MVTRRDFHKGVFGLAMLGMTSGRAWASGEKLSDLGYLNRLTYGATETSLTEFSQLGLGAWLDQELAKPISDPALDRRLSAARLHIEYEAGSSDSGETWDAVNEMRPYTMLDATPLELVQFLDYEQAFDFAERERPGTETIAASFIRTTHADAQLREVMTQFWHEHFSVNALKDAETALFFPEYDRIMRRNAFGNFRVMLGQVSRAPTMLYYLNNASSFASPANENYARELLELHTMGAENYLNDLYDNWCEVPGAEDGMAIGYIDQDVYEVARAFTGWTVGDGDWMDGGGEKPVTGEFHYAEIWHDPYQKRILGVEFDSNSAPMADGDKVLDMLAAHPATARFVTEKILRRLGLENPSAGLKAQVADVFAKAVQDDDQIAQVIRTIVLSDEFASTKPDKLRRPLEFVIALYRAVGAEAKEPQFDLHWQLERMGWTQHQVRPPTGHSDKSEDWANTRALNGMIDFSLYAFDGWMEGIVFSPQTGALTWGKFAQYWADALHAPDTVTKDFLKGMELRYNDPLTDDPEYLLWGANNAIALAALNPSFMFR